MLNSVTATRCHRPNAGSRMARLLNAEDEDEFYTNAYGGFAEEADDNDYESESSGHDSIDSDFVDSEDEVSSDEADEDEKKKRRSRRVVTKSYKEPATKKKEMVERVKTEPRHRTKPTSEETPTDAITDGRRLRASTVRAHTTKRNASPESTALKRKAIMAEIAQRKNVTEVRRLTQEELLAEAKITEEINKRSLATPTLLVTATIKVATRCCINLHEELGLQESVFPVQEKSKSYVRHSRQLKRLEIERKKTRVQKTASQQPMVRTHSFTVPSVADQPEVYGVSVDVESGDVSMRQMLVNHNSRCSRALVTFTDVASFTSIFPSTAVASNGKLVGGPPRKRTRYCPLTGRVASYVDPLTRTPYADLAAFRALRYLYRLHLETGTPAIELLRQYRSGEIRCGDAEEA